MSITSKPTAWLLLDERPGHQTQVLGVGKALGSINEIIPLRFNALSKLHPQLMGARCLGIDKGSKEALVPPYPDIVIAAGRRCTPILRALKKRAPDTHMVQIMWPGKAYEELDTIIVPAHDDIAEDAQIITTLGAPHNVQAAQLEEAQAAWQGRFTNFTKPVGVLIGGATKQSDLRREDAPAMATMINQHGSALITTSRRTPQGFVDALLGAINVPVFLYMYGDSGENPYHGILACADELIVTGDSMSMLCEAYYTQKPVHLFAPSHLCGHKHLRFHEALTKRGTEPQLDEATRIAEILRERLR